MSASRDLGSSETRSNLETLGGGNREHGVGESSLELVEAGLPELVEGKREGDASELLRFKL